MDIEETAHPDAITVLLDDGIGNMPSCTRLPLLRTFPRTALHSPRSSEAPWSSLLQHRKASEVQERAHT